MAHAMASFMWGVPIRCCSDTHKRIENDIIRFPADGPMNAVAFDSNSHSGWFLGLCESDNEAYQHRPERVVLPLNGPERWMEQLTAFCREHSIPDADLDGEPGWYVMAHLDETE